MLDDELDWTKPLEDTAKQAYDLRCQLKTTASGLMKNTGWGDIVFSNKGISYGKLLGNLRDEGLDGDELYNTIIDGCEDSSATIDKLAGLGQKISQDELNLTKSAADNVADEFGGTVEIANNNKGFKVTIPGKGKYLGQNVVVRFMGTGSGKSATPYFRVSIFGKGCVNEAGEFSNIAKDTHIPLTDDYYNKIKYMLKNFSGYM